MPKPRKPSHSSQIPTINLEKGMPLVHEALTLLERQLTAARHQHISIFKLIHGYGSTGVGGDLRIAIQKRLRELQDAGTIQCFILGEDWSPSDTQAWDLLKRHPELKYDPDLGRSNRGITVVIL
jgi:hypothetical protein